MDVCHRDIKPENLMFLDETGGTVVVVDWLFATRVVDSTPTVYRGSRHFVSPDVAAHIEAEAHRHTDAEARYCFKRRDDLHSWLRVCLVYSNCSVMRAVYNLIALHGRLHR